MVTSRQSLLTRALVFYGVSLPNHPRKWWLHAWLREKLGVAPQQEVEVFRNGLYWYLTPSEYGHSSLFWLNSRDRWDIENLRRLVQPDHVILDAGANYGYYGLTFASTLNGQGIVHAL